jgi:hypothetical protein
MEGGVGGVGKVAIWCQPSRKHRYRHFLPLEFRNSFEMLGWIPLFVTFLAVSESKSYFFDRFKQSQSVLAGDSNDNERDLISFGHWEALGPFRIGTRGTKG